MIKRIVAPFAVLALAAALLTGCWPEASDTGPRTGHTLGSPVAGWYFDNCSLQDCTVEDQHINGNIVVDGVHVTVSDSLISGAGLDIDFGVKTINGGSIDMQYVEIEDYNEAGIYENDWTCYYCDIHDMDTDGVKLGSNTQLVSSYIHNFTPDVGSHADGAQLQAGGVENVLVAGNNFELGTGVNSDIFIEAFFGPGDGPVTIDTNFLDGGTYSLYVVDGNSNPSNVIDAVNVRNNHFLYASYQYGPISTSSYVIDTNLFVCGNLYDDYEETAPMDTPWGDECEE